MLQQPAHIILLQYSRSGNYKATIVQIVSQQDPEAKILTDVGRLGGGDAAVFVLVRFSLLPLGANEGVVLDEIHQLLCFLTNCNQWV